MLKRLVFILALVVFAAHGARAADDTDKVDGRAFQVHIPVKVEGQKNLPVVLFLHGGGGNATQVRTQTGFDEVSDRHGFIAVYPEGSEGIMGKLHTWNAGLCCGKSVTKNIDDVGFISKVIDKLVEKYHVDATRVYATGHSNGGMMSYRLACELADKITAIAPNAGTRVFSDCHPSRAVPVLHFHGTADPCVPYNGGAQCGGCFSHAVGMNMPGDHWPCSAVKSIVAEHAKLNGCANETETVFTKGAVTCIKYKGCPDNTAVGLCTIEGGGHRWPGSHDDGGEACAKHPDGFMCRRYSSAVGGANQDIDAGEMAWDFFRQFHIERQK